VAQRSAAEIQSEVPVNRRILALGRDQALMAQQKVVGQQVLYVDTLDGAPVQMQRFQTLNPFHCFEREMIPVPGSSYYSRSVESIWQGLRIVNGETCFEMFKSKARKRPSEQDRLNRDFDYKSATFLYDQATISLLEARFLIYAVTYLYLLENLVPSSLIDEIYRAICNGQTIIFYDWDSNMEIADTSSSFSHSALLRAWFAGTLESELLVPAWQNLSNSRFESFRQTYALNTGRYQSLHSRRGSR